jgi:hypothetical protein
LCYGGNASATHDLTSDKVHYRKSLDPSGMRHACTPKTPAQRKDANAAHTESLKLRLHLFML